MNGKVRLEINTTQLLQGFVHSFNSLQLPTTTKDEEYCNSSQETHAIIDYFRRLGIALGYYPRCEYNKNDLEWYDESDRIIFHFETENSYYRFSRTIDKFINSHAKICIGIVWTKKPFKALEKILVKKLSDMTRGRDSQILIIVRSGVDSFIEKCNGLSPPRPPISEWKVRSWLAEGGECRHLEEYDWLITWPEKDGFFQTARWVNIDG